MKKKIALLLSVAMLTASLAGCGGKSGSTSAPSGDSGSATTEAGGTAAGGHKDTLVIKDLSRRMPIWQNVASGA